MTIDHKAANIYATCRTVRDIARAILAEAYLDFAAQLEAERMAQIWEFSEEETPIFRETDQPHELETKVDAARCTHLVQVIQDERANRKSAEADARELFAAAMLGDWTAIEKHRAKYGRNST